MNSGSKKRHKSLLLSLLCLVLLCIILIVFCLPALLSSRWGKQKLLGYFKSTYGLDVSCEKISVKWFGPLEISALEVRQENLLFTCTQVQTDASLLQLLFKHDVGHLRCQQPYLKLYSSQNRSNIALECNTFDQASCVPLGSIKSVTLSASSSYKGSVEGVDGKIELVSQDMPWVLFDAVAFYVENISEHLSARLSCKTEQNGVVGKIDLNATLMHLDAAFPEIRGHGEIAKLPVEGLDQLLATLRPQYANLLVTALGNTADAAFDVHMTEDDWTCAISISSPLCRSAFSLASKEKEIYLTEPAFLDFKITPAFFHQFSKLTLCQEALLQATISHLSLPIPKNLDNISIDSLDAALEVAEPLTLTFGQAPFTLNGLKAQMQSSAANQPIVFEAATTLNAFDASVPCSLKGNFNPASGEGSYQLSVPQFPTSLLAKAANVEELSSWIGSAVSLNGIGNMREKTLSLQLQSDQLQLQQAKLALGDAITLQAPAAFTYLLTPQNIPRFSLTEPATFEGVITCLSLPLRNMGNRQAMQVQWEMATHEMQLGNPSLSFKDIKAKASFAGDLFTGNLTSAIQGGGNFAVDFGIYRNNLKNREFGEEAAQIFGLERATIVRAQGVSEGQKFAAKLTSPKTDSSSCFGIQQATIDALVKLQNMPTSFLDTLLATSLCSPLLGTTATGSLKIHSTPEQGQVKASLISPLVNIKNVQCAFDAQQLTLESPSAITWTLSSEGYRALDHLMTKSNQKFAFELQENTTFQLTLSKAVLPVNSLVDRIPTLCLNPASLQCALQLSNPSILFFDPSSQESFQLTSNNLSVNKTKESSLSLAYETKVSSQPTSKKGASKMGFVSLKADIAHLFDRVEQNKGLDITTRIALQVKDFPSRLLDLASRFKGRTDFPFTKTLGTQINASLQADISQKSGPISLQADSPHLKLSLAGILHEGALLLEQPFYAQLKITPEMSILLLKEINPLSLNYFYSEAPVTFEIPAKGFYLPFFPLNTGLIAIPSARIDLGKIACRNEGNVNIALNLLKSKQFEKNKELLLWFAPLDFHVKQGVVDIERTEILLETSDIAIWGKILLLKNYVDMILGLPAITLTKAFGIKNLPPDYVLTIPMKGPFDNVKISTNKATTKIALLLASQQKALTDAFGKNPAGAILGGVLQQMTLPDNEPVPPAKHPFPWEKAKNNLRKSSHQEDVKGKKRHFRQDDKPLKQILKVLR